MVQVKKVVGFSRMAGDTGNPSEELLAAMAQKYLNDKLAVCTGRGIGSFRVISVTERQIDRISYEITAWVELSCTHQPASHEW